MQLSNSSLDFTVNPIVSSRQHDTFKDREHHCSMTFVAHNPLLLVDCHWQSFEFHTTSVILFAGTQYLKSEIWHLWNVCARMPNICPCSNFWVWWFSVVAKSMGIVALHYLLLQSTKSGFTSLWYILELLNGGSWWLWIVATLEGIPFDIANRTHRSLSPIVELK